MIKYLLLTTLFFAFSFSLRAQDPTNPSDSTTQKKPIVSDTVKTEQDTIPETTKPSIPPKDTVKKVVNPPKVYSTNPSDTDNGNTTNNGEPKIIYYQSVKDDDGWVKVKRKEKRRGRDRYGRRDIHTITGRNSHGGGFGALSFKSTELENETLVMAGVRGGWIINRALGIGFEGYGIIPTATITDVNPQDVMPIGGYGGMFLEPVFFSNQVVHVTFPVSAGAGWLGYYEENSSGFGSLDGDQVAEDVFWYVEPGASIEINIARNFRLAGGVSKRFTEDLEILETRNEDFNTLSYFITLKIGSF